MVVEGVGQALALAGLCFWEFISQLCSHHFSVRRDEAPPHAYRSPSKLASHASLPAAPAQPQGFALAHGPLIQGRWVGVGDRGATGDASPLLEGSAAGCGFRVLSHKVIITTQLGCLGGLNLGNHCTSG